MSGAGALLESLRAAGAAVRLDGGRLRVTVAAGVIPAGLRTRVVAERDTILALVVAEGAANGAPTEQPRVASGTSREIPNGVDPVGSGDTDDLGGDLDQYAANALALSPEDRAAWRREVVHGMVWAEAGRGQDPGLASSVMALRRVVPPGRCLRCDAACPADGRHWCGRCAYEYPKTTEVIQ